MAKAKKTTSKQNSKITTKVAKSSKKNVSVKKEKTEKLELKKSKKSPKFYDELKLSESYVSLILGAVVVIGVSIVFFAYVKESRKATATEVLNSAISPTISKAIERKHTMQENESLWDVAVKYYGDGFAYPRIVEANKDVITNPDYVPPGTVIVIPN